MSVLTHGCLPGKVRMASDVDDTALGTDERALTGHQFLMHCLQLSEMLHQVHEWRMWLLNKLGNEKQKCVLRDLLSWIVEHFMTQCTAN